MLIIYHSNRLEQLLDALAAATVTPTGDPLGPEVIVAQNQGMARWLSLRLAECLGVAANLDFPLPASFVWRVFRSQLVDVPERSSFDRESLRWRCMAVLPEHLNRPGFEDLRRYLVGEDQELKHYQLCDRIADVFDQYLVYRPEMITAWEAGDDQQWQAQLWRAIVAQSSSDHRGLLLQRFLEHCTQGKLTATGLPRRVSVFGIAALPPAYLKVLATISKVVEVHLFVLNPCLAYWGDIVEERDLARLRGLWRKHGKSDVSRYYEIGNPLLASLGKLGRDYQEQIHEYPCEDHDLFEPPRTLNLLGVLQLDILMLQARGGSGMQPCLAVEHDDHSLQIHSCHSRMREVEVLHDQLLAFFDTDGDLRPQDVVVMAPDIDAYAPHVDAVFGAAPQERVIPWAIADRSAQSEQPIIQVFLRLLELPSSRFTASEVLSILEVPAVLRRFGLDAMGYERVREWVQESGIRWGIDGPARARMGLPENDENSWRFGVQRMLLGYAMPREASLFEGILPYGDIEGAEARYLGSLQSFIRVLLAFRDALAGQHPPRAWLLRLNALLDALIAPDEDDTPALQWIRDLLDQMVEHAERVGFEQTLGIDVVREHLNGCLSEPGITQRFLSGKVTFCNMVPMRSIPFRVVCLLGMNHQDYPRTHRPVGFDLIAQAPRKGDRSRREDDRYLFLEALLSARDVFYISYLGNSVRDNSPMLPAVLVDELLDSVAQGFELIDPSPDQQRGRETIREHVITRHPLQPFSPRYFRLDGRLFSYAQEWLRGAQGLSGQDARIQPFVSKPLPEPEPDRKTVDLDALVRFYRNPARFFLNERLGVYLEEGEGGLADAECFALDPLEGYRLKQEVLQQALEGRDLEEHYAKLKASGALPLGAFGRAEYEAVRGGAPPLVASLAPWLEQILEPVEVDLAFGEFQLRGWLQPVTRPGLLRYRYTKIKPEDRVLLWIHHLALNIVAPAGCDLASVHVGEDADFTLPPIDEPEQHLHDLLQTYWQGLARPLAFFPRSTWAYAEKLAQGKSEAEAMRAACKVWEDGFVIEGEGSNSYYQTAFRGREPLDEDFQQLAELLVAPACRLGKTVKRETTT